MTSPLKRLLRIAQLIFAFFLAYIAFRLIFYHAALVTFPFSDGLREGAMMTTTNALVKGLNPYDMSLQPWYMNQYGIVYPLMVWPWAKLFGITILVHRAVTAFFILASCVLIFLVLNKLLVHPLLNIWAVEMLYASLLYPVTSTATIDPGATGTFLFLLTIFIPWFCNYSYRSLVLSVFCGILAFYTKAYVFLGVFIMASYIFFFISKRKGLFYTCLLTIVSLISVVLVNHLLPAYFDNCFFTSANMAHAWSSMGRLHEQINSYTHLHFWILILMGIILVIEARHLLRNGTFPLVLYAALCSSFVLYMSLGRHSGAMLWYFFQLLSPFLLIGAAWVFNRNSYWPLLCIPFLIYNLYVMSMDESYKWFDKKMPGWNQIVPVMGRYHHILNSPIIAPIMIEQGKDIVDDGQAEYFGSGGLRNYWMKGLFKEDERVPIQLMTYFQNIKSMLEKREFDLIILQPSLLPLGVADDIKKYYKYEGQLELFAPQDRRSYAVTLWLPN